MDIRSQISMVFHLDKCIGCHTCSVACKNIWTDRKGAEYMWWNNVETKPGIGYPKKWEDQEVYQGGWELKSNGEIELKGAGKRKGLLNIFHNPHLPTIDNYYEPFTYTYSNLINAQASDTQPVAKPISLITGKPIDIKSGPNWDDDLGGSQEYARQDINLKNLSHAESEAMFQLEKMALFYLPRICNHCLNPACVASCPSGAIYKRGEDGIVLINQDVCRAWRMCVTACPYKKTYYNWSTGKSEKCILCYPRVEADLVPVCMHSCVGRIRYLGVLLYDADKIHQMASVKEHELVDAQLDIIVDPNNPQIIQAAKANGIPDSTLKAAQNSPIYKFVKTWGLALPLHPEYRTFPMLFYVPPLLPVMASVTPANNEEQLKKLNAVSKVWDDKWLYDTSTNEIWGTIDQARFPVQYLANLFSAGDTTKVTKRLKMLMAIRMYRRHKTVGDIPEKKAFDALNELGLSFEEAEDIYNLTSLAKFDDRFVIPASHREQALEMLEHTGDAKGKIGFGAHESVRRGF